MRTLAIAALLTTAGCGNTTPPSTPATPPAAASTPHTAAPTTPGPLRIGTPYTGTASDVTLTVTVYHVRDVRSHADIAQPSHRFIGADIKACVNKATRTVGLSWMPWRIDYTDATQANPIGEYWDGEFDVPLYPNDNRQVDIGQCARGWIIFQRHTGRPARVTYAAEGMAPASWRVPASVS